ncbi:MAG: hypothetical protein M3O30_14415 [Planctomycetota bacterium]|nr:hypothetical protein [Planctomycetota bacterium]
MLYPKKMGIFAALLLVSLIAAPVLAQNNGGNGGGGGFGGQNGPPDPQQIQQFVAQMRQRVMDNIKTQLGSSDDEFAVLQPKIQKVLDEMQTSGAQALQRRAFSRGSRFAGLFNSQEANPVTEAADDLRKTLDDTASSPDAIRSKMDTLREAKAKARQDLTAAREDLKNVLTIRQEAVLVGMGLLE